MDEQTLKTMPEYVQKLPKKVQDFVFDGEWEERTREIADKYTLYSDVADKLIDEVLLVLIGLETPDEFVGGLASELQVSDLLAEQLIQDVEKRIFEYALKEIGESKNPATPTNTERKMSEKVFDSPQKNTTSEDVEIRPDITPLVESNEVAHTTPKVSVPRYTVPENLPVEKSGISSSFAPKVPDISKVPKPITLEQPTVIQQTKPAPTSVPETPKKYTVDPYREPIE